MHRQSSSWRRWIDKARKSTATPTQANPEILSQSDQVSSQGAGSCGGEASRLATLGRMSLERFNSLHKLEDLHDAIDAQERAAKLMREGHADWLYLADDHAHSLRRRFENYGALEDIDRAIEFQERALIFTPGNSPKRPWRLDCLAICLRLRYGITGTLRDLEMAVTKHRLALALTCDSTDGQPGYLSSFANSLRSRFERFGELRDLEEAIAAHKLAVDLTPDGNPDLPLQLRNLASSLVSRFKHLGELRDLEQAITANKLAIRLTPDGHPDRPQGMSNLAGSLQSRFQRLGDLRDLGETIAMQKLAVDLTPEGHPDRPQRLGNLANSLSSRFECFGELRYLEEAIAAHRLAVNLTPEGHLERPLQWSNLAHCLRSRFERLGELRDLEEAIALNKLAVGITPKEHIHRPLRLSSLAGSLWSRFQRLGKLSDLEEAIAVNRLAVSLMPDGHPDRPQGLSNLAGSLTSRYERFGELRDLAEATVADRLTVDLTPEGHPDRPWRLSTLAISLSSRFERLGELRDLEEAFAVHKLAIELTPEGRPNRPYQLSSLGCSLMSRFQRLGELRDLEEALATHKRAIELTPEDHPGRPIRLSHLAGSFWSRFQRLGELHDLEEAIALHKLAIALTPEAHPDRPPRLSGLAGSIWSRFGRLGELHDLEDAIAANQLAVELTPEGHPGRRLRLHNLAASLGSRFECLGELRDLEEAIVAGELAVELTPEGHPDSPVFISHMGILLKALFASEPSKMRFNAALEQLMKATVQTLGNPESRLKSARACVSLLSEYPEFSSAELVLQAHSKIIQIFPEIVWLGHSLERRYSELAQLGNEVNSAVAAFIRLHSRHQAIEWMEAGRSLVWSQMFSLRQPLGDLERVYPKLASRLRQISSALQHLDSLSQPTQERFHLDSGQAVANADHGMRTTADEGVVLSSVDRRRQLAIDYDDILKHIRGQEGFEDFLRPAKINSLLTSIERLDGPVVFINVHSSSCDALVLFPNGGIENIALPKLSERHAQGLRSTWTKLLRSSGLRVRGSTSVGSLAEGRMDILGTVLERLWTCIVSPILDALHFMVEVPAAEHKLPHITWCATGPLTQLPLHAAGIYGQPQTLSHTYDFVVSSYTPSLSALLRCHQQPGTYKQFRPNVLIIAQPDTPTYASLPHTRVECKRLRAAMPEKAYTFKSLMHEQGTVANALNGLGHHHWVHLACHGKQSADNPTQSAFALYDGELTLAALMGTIAGNAELAFLSACETAVGDEKIPEESAHLAAGMLAVGFKGVVGTMWSIGDADAPTIVGAYYRRLHKLRESKREGIVAPGYTGAAYALHHAVKVLRERVGEQNFMKWAPYVHFGV
ncbi:unnamed protein product [Peniophora sp. CBMAI 1063]|nr:unnamed protein product [Peniophora sp. CBMAI 1063]